MSMTVLKLWNQALGALGTSDIVGSETEVSPEAEACVLYYETARDAVFRAAPWSSLTSFFRLANYATRDDDVDWQVTDPPPGFTYAFTLPNDLARPRFLSDYSRFTLTRVGSRRVIATNGAAPILCYTAVVTDPDKWDVDLQQAVTYSLAAHVAKRVTGNDSDLNNMYTLANELILTARANDANINHEGQLLEWVPDWLQARGTNLASPDSKYIYPSADFTVLGSPNLG
jgi:hypothetical protein